MNEPSRKRRPLLKHLAAATAATLGTAVLVTAGPVAAQDTGIDCAGIGSNPIAAGLEAALETAVACDVEVRLEREATPHSTVYVTPQGQVRFVGTVDPVQDNRGHGAADTTLVEAGEGLTQAGTPWPVTLSRNDTDAPLLTAGAGYVDWSGEQPVPTYAGSVAEYGELAAGLSLTAETGVSETELRFTVADLAAWESLVAGLSVTTDLGVYGYMPGMATVVTSYESPETNVAGLTPFKLVDADGTVAAARLSLPRERPYGGNLTVHQPTTPLEELSFPLSVTTEWVFFDRWASNWGAVTSASPKLPLFRGDAGLDEPYFEAAGAGANLVVGSYCDQLVDPGCSTSYEAAAYWTFEAPSAFFINPADATWLSQPIVSATFSIDSADGSDCVAPDLYHMDKSGSYHAGYSWAYRETEGILASSGECQGTTAVYDVTDDIPRAYTIDLAMLGSDETARFDGGSARIEIVRDIRNFTLAGNVCDPEGSHSGWTSEDTTWQRSSTVHNGNFKAWVWRPDLIETDLTWAATLRNTATGKTIATSPPAPVADGANLGTAYAGLSDGRYSIEYQFTSAHAGFTKSATCYVVVDSTAPEITGYTVTGDRRLGDTVAIEVAVADAGFPESGNTLIVHCGGTVVCDSPSKPVSGSDSVTFEATLTESSNWISLWVRDGAWNTSGSTSTSLQAADPGTDFNGDGKSDLMAVRKSNGHLMFYAGRGDGTFASGVSLGYGWGRMDVVMAGDLTGNGTPDLLARDTKTGTLYTYPGNGRGGLDRRVTVGGGWNGIGVFTAAADADDDGLIDLFAVGKANSNLYFYPGKGDGTFGARTLADAASNGWGAVDSLTTLSDLGSGDSADLLARNSRTGEYLLLPAANRVNLSQAVTVEPSLSADAAADRYSQVLGAGDLDGDGTSDVAAVDARTGRLVLHSVDETGAAVVEPRVVGTGWGAMRLPAVQTDGAYDYNEDGKSDFIARRASDGTLQFYPGNGAAGHGARIQMGTGWAGMGIISTAGDMNGDGFADLLARKDSTGELFLYPGDGKGGYVPSARVLIGSGWNAMGAIVGGHDHNSDGQADVIAVDASSGRLYLYPGKGDGTLGSRITIGSSGWNAMREVTAVGDLDHDGHADLLAVGKSDGCLYFYGGSGTGTLKSRVKVGCGWGAMDAITAVGDFNRDGHADWLARRKSDGALFLYPGNGAGNHTSSKSIGTGWNAMNAIA